MDLGLLVDVVVHLTTTGTLPAKYKPHPLVGNYAGYMECHIQRPFIGVEYEKKHYLIETPAPIVYFL